MTYTMVVGTTKPQDFQITSDDAPFNAADYAVAIVFRVPIEAVVLEVAWLSEATSTVRVTGVETLPVGRHKFRFSIEDDAGNIEYSPNHLAEPHTWVVVAA
jgi:hypothetical protein